MKMERAPRSRAGLSLLAQEMHQRTHEMPLRALGAVWDGVAIALMSVSVRLNRMTPATHPPRHDRWMPDEWRRDRDHGERLDSSSASCYQGAEIPWSRFYLRPSGRLKACRATRMGSLYSPRPQARAPLGPPGQAWVSDCCRHPCTVMQRGPCGYSRRGQPLWHRHSLMREDT